MSAWFTPAEPVEPNTAACAAGCGQPIDLAQLHVSIVRQTEREADGQIHVQGSTVLEYLHLDDCTAPEVV